MKPMFIEEVKLKDAASLFIGKTIVKMDTSCCNNIEFLFSDGTKVAIHIDVDHLGLPELLACVHCCEITL